MLAWPFAFDDVAFVSSSTLLKTWTGRQSQLSDSKLASGLQEALRVGGQVREADGRTDGYFANQAIKILVQKISSSGNRVRAIGRRSG